MTRKMKGGRTILAQKFWEFGKMSKILKKGTCISSFGSKNLTQFQIISEISKKLDS